MALSFRPNQTLRAYGFARRPTGRLWVFGTVAALLLPVSILAAVVVSRLTEASLPASLAPFLTFEILLLGLWQWRAQRSEISLDRYFDRLELANKYRLEYFGKYAEACATDGAVQGEDRQRAVQQFYFFYVFTEIDSLEYAARRYHYGYMPDDLAERAVLTFENRCRHSPAFWVAANELTTAYPKDIKDLIEIALARTKKDMELHLSLSSAGSQGTKEAFMTEVANSLEWADKGEYRRFTRVLQAERLPG